MNRVAQYVHALLRSFRLWTAMLGVLVTGVAIMVLLGHVSLPGTHTFDRLAHDQRLRWMPTVFEPRVLVVDIDEKSLQEQGRWTWPRRTLARLVERIVDEGHARVLGFDIVFAEPDPEDDGVLARAIQGRPVVLGYYFSRHAGAHRIGHLPGAVFDGNLFDGTLLPQWDGFGANLDRLGEAARSSGFYNAQLDRDGVVRSVPVLTLFNGQMYESLALAILRVYEDNPPITLNGHVLSLSGPRPHGTRTLCRGRRAARRPLRIRLGHRCHRGTGRSGPLP